MQMEPASAHARAARWLAWMLVAVVVAQAAAYLARVANPLVVSDTWYWVDVFLRKAAEDQLTLGDFFAKRSAVDHALPFHKALLLLNTRLFGLDLTMDAWIGFAFAVATIVLLRDTLRRSSSEAAFAGWAMQATWVALAAVYLSRNATQPFEWPLLALSFLALFCCFALFLGAWRMLEGRGPWPMAAALAAVLLVSDGGGVIAVIAAALATALYAARQRRARRSLLVVTLLLGVTLAYKGALVAFVQPPMGAAAGRDWATLLAQADAPWRLLVAVTQPLSAAVLHPEHGAAMFGRFAPGVDAVLRACFAIAHLAFWWQAWTRRTSAAWFTAVATMLLCYGLVAGVLVGRVPQFGEAVFLQPRYVIFYQLHVVALLLMAACWLSDRLQTDRAASPAMAWALVACCAGLVAVQLPLDVLAWRRAPFHARYVGNIAAQMDRLAATPAVVPDGCLPQVIVCRMPPDVRTRAVGFLRDHQLNLYSPAFRRRHGFAPAP